MPGYRTREVMVRLGGHDYRIRALSDRQQFADPHGLAQRLGISSAMWSLFGQVWPSGLVLAQAMSTFDIAGKRMLEIGCGLGLASLVLQRRGANIIASDHHPLAKPFLDHNAALNKLPALRFRDLDWSKPDHRLGRFDVILASDVLYERDHAPLLADVLDRHAKPGSQIVFTDPGRGNSAAFSRHMEGQGFEVFETRSPMGADDLPPYRGRLLCYSRSVGASVPAQMA